MKARNYARNRSPFNGVTVIVHPRTERTRKSLTRYSTAYTNYRSSRISSDIYPRVISESRERYIIAQSSYSPLFAVIIRDAKSRFISSDYRTSSLNFFIIIRERALMHSSRGAVFKFISQISQIDKRKDATVCNTGISMQIL